MDYDSMRRDLESNKLLEDMVDKAVTRGATDHIKIAQKAYPRIASDRRRELTISRLAQQIKAKLRRKLPKQPSIPGLLDDAAQR
jgi:hypothetical protein